MNRNKDSSINVLHESLKVGPIPSYAREKFSDDATDEAYSNDNDGIAPK